MNCLLTNCRGRSGLLWICEQLATQVIVLVTDRGERSWLSKTFLNTRFLNWYFLVFNLHHTLQNGAIIVYLGSSHLWRFRVQWQRLMSAGSPFPLFIIALALGLGQAKLSFPGIPQFRVFLLLFFFYGHIQLIFILVFTIQCILLITLFTGTLQPSIQMTLYFFILYLQAEQSFPVTEGGYNE